MRGAAPLNDGVDTPGYYTSLAPFRGLFARGNPVLTYHKVGRRPRAARLKGLYVSADLFARQLEELRAAGFRSGKLSDAAGPLQTGRIVLTFDDGFVNVLENAVEPLRFVEPSTTGGLRVAISTR